MTSSIQPVGTDNPSPSIISIATPFIINDAANSGNFLLQKPISFIESLYLLVVSKISPISRNILSIPTDISNKSLLKFVHFLFSTWIFFLSLFSDSTFTSLLSFFLISSSFNNVNCFSESEYCIRISNKYLEHQSSKLYLILQTNISFSSTVRDLNISFKKDDIISGRPSFIF